MIDDPLRELARNLAWQCRQRERGLRRHNVWLCVMGSISIGVASGFIALIVAFDWPWYEWLLGAANAYNALHCLHCWQENRRRIAESRRIAGAFEGIGPDVDFANPVVFAHHVDQTQAAFRDLERLLLQ